MTVRFLAPWRQFKAGETCDTLDEGIARTVIDRHIAVEVPAERRGLFKPKRNKGEPQAVETK